MTFQMIEEDFERLPGLYVAWDLTLLLEEGRSYLIEDGGRTDDGRALFTVFCRPTGADHEN